MLVMHLSPEVPRHDGADHALLSNLAELARPLVAERSDRLIQSDESIRVSLDSFTQSNADQLTREAIALAISSRRSFQIYVELDEERREKLSKNWPQLAGSDGYLVTVRPTEAETVQGFLRLFADAL